MRERKAERRQHLEPFTHEHVFPPLPLPSGPSAAASLHTGGYKRRMRAEQEDRRVTRLLAVPERRTGRLPEEQLLSGAAYCRIVPPGESKTQAAKGSLLAAARWRHRPVRRGASERTLG